MIDTHFELFKFMALHCTFFNWLTIGIAIVVVILAFKASDQ